MNRRLSRRQFLRNAAAVAAPAIVPASVFGQDRPAPSGRITMGVIGVGGMGVGNLSGFLADKEVQVVAVCDVDTGGYDAGSRKDFGRDPVKLKVEKHYAEKAKDGTYKGCAAYKDFRELCARKDIDAVVVATPDHWHALCALEALRNGKDVYCEKPITHLFAEGRAVCEAVKKYGRVWQTGSQQRSESNFRRAVEMVRNGLIGKVERVEVGLPKGHEKANGDTRPQDPPKGLDYDSWCGPSQKLPYIPARLHFHWRWNMNYGGGQLMDWIGHHNDIAHWGLDSDSSGPVEVEAGPFVFPQDRSVYDAPVHYEVRCRYANGTTTSLSNKHPMGTKWYGTDGWVYVDRGKLDASNKEWLKKEFDLGPVKVYASPGHRRNFIECVKSRKPCVAPAETAHRSATPGHLGYLSLAVGRKIRWDPAAEKVIDDPAAEKLLAVNYRAPWKLEV